MFLTHNRGKLISAVCIFFGAAQIWAANYLTTTGAPGQAWQLEGGFGTLLWAAGLVSACTGLWAGISTGISMRRRV